MCFLLEIYKNHEWSLSLLCIIIKVHQFWSNGFESTNNGGSHITFLNVSQVGRVCEKAWDRVDDIWFSIVVCLYEYKYPKLKSFSSEGPSVSVLRTGSTSSTGGNEFGLLSMGKETTHDLQLVSVKHLSNKKCAFVQFTNIAAAKTAMNMLQDQVQSWAKDWKHTQSSKVAWYFALQAHPKIMFQQVLACLQYCSFSSVFGFEAGCDTLNALVKKPLFWSQMPDSFTADLQVSFSGHLGQTFSCLAWLFSCSKYHFHHVHWCCPHKL